MSQDHRAPTTPEGSHDVPSHSGAAHPPPPTCQPNSQASQGAPIGSTSGETSSWLGREAEQEWRPWGIGGSDIGALLGVSPYRGAVDVWLDKVRPIGTTRPAAALPMRLGNFLEPFVVEEYERVTGRMARKVESTLHHPAHPELFGHLDRVAALSEPMVGAGSAGGVGQVVLECKTSSAFRANEWGPAWSDKVPAEYLAQCLWYLGLAQHEEAHLAVLLGNSDFRVYRIKRDQDIERYMFDLAHRFWVDHVLPRRAPPAATRSEAQALHPQPEAGSSVAAKSRTLAALRRKARLEVKLGSIEGEIERLKDSVAVAMGSAERLTWQGKTVATWHLGRGSTRLDTERLRRERPDIAEHYTVTGGDSRRLKFDMKALSATKPGEAP